MLDAMPSAQISKTGVLPATTLDSKSVAVPAVQLPAPAPVSASAPEKDLFAEEESDLASETESDTGPDTVSLSEEQVGFQGNWRKKKYWLVKTNELSNEIYSIVAQIQGAREAFNEKYTAIDNQLDDFYKELGLDQGKLQELFDSLERYLDKKKKKKIEEIDAKQEDQTLKDRDYIIKIELISERIKDYKNNLDQLKLDMKSIEDLDKSVTARLKKLDEQISAAVKESSKVHKVTQELWDIIDHRKAREYYYQLKGNVLEKLKAIKDYLERDLLQDFERVSQQIKTQISKVRSEVDDLEKKELIIRDRAQRVEQLKLKELRALDEAKKRAAQEEQTKPKRVVKKTKTFLNNTYDWFTTGVAYIITQFKNVYSKLFGPKKLTKKVKAQVPAKPAAVMPAASGQKQIPVQKKAPGQKQAPTLPHMSVHPEERAQGASRGAPVVPAMPTAIQQ